MDFLQTKHKVRHHECGGDGAMKLAPLLDRFQNGAAEHADALGVGMLDMLGNDLLWVLARLKIQVIVPLKLGEEYTLTTYPSGLERIFCSRQYAISVNGAPRICASSDWLVLHATGRPANPKKILPAQLPENVDKEKYFSGLADLPEVQGVPCGNYRIGYGDVDLNHHLNNAVYGRFITDALGRLGGGIPAISEVQINFMHAGLPDDELAVTGTLDGGSFALQGMWSNGNCAFRAAGKCAIAADSSALH